MIWRWVASHGPFKSSRQAWVLPATGNSRNSRPSFLERFSGCPCKPSASTGTQKHGPICFDPNPQGCCTQKGPWQEVLTHLGHPERSHVRACPNLDSSQPAWAWLVQGYLGMGQNRTTTNRTACSSPCFYLPGFHFGYRFLVRSHLFVLVSASGDPHGSPRPCPNPTIPVSVLSSDGNCKVTWPMALPQFPN